MVCFGIIGVGAMGQEHIRNIAILEGSSVAAIADTSPEMLEQAIRSVAVGGGATKPTAYSDYRDLLSSAEVDAVIICTPNCHHHEVLLAAIPSGKHILCEKPLCTTVEHCVDICKRTEGYAGVFWVGMEYRFMPSVARLIEEVDAGTIGRLRMLSIREHRFPFLLKVGNWNRFTANTGGTLVEKCVHFFDLMNRIVGARPVRVYASGGQDVNHLDEAAVDAADVGTGTHSGVPDILDNAFVITDYANGARAHLDLCMFAEASRHQEELCAVGDLGHNNAGHNYVGHNCRGHNLIGHSYAGQDCIGHNYAGHDYIGHNCRCHRCLTMYAITV